MLELEVRDMEKFYTIGEVSKITQIEKRTIKYYLERQIITPSYKKKKGDKNYWFYSEADLLKIRQVELYRELGYSANDIRKLISTPDFDWEKVLNKQIVELKKKKRHLENLIFAAEMMRYMNECEEELIVFDISDFENNIDGFARNLFNCDACDAEKLISQNMEKIERDLVQNITLGESYKQGRLLLDRLTAVKNAMSYPPDSPEMQESLANLFACFEPMLSKENINLHDVLFGYRLTCNLGFDRIVDMLFSHENSTEYLAKALQKYRATQERGRLNG